MSNIFKKIKNVRMGKDVILRHEVELNDVSFEEAAFVAHHAQISFSKIGNHTSIGRYTKIRQAEIGSYCSISWDTTIGAVTHPMNTITTCALTYRKQYQIVNKDSKLLRKTTIIGNDVWIGCGTIIISGVKIGNGAIIGAGAVVTKDVKPYEIVAGVPAKHIKYRFDKEICESINAL